MDRTLLFVTLCFSYAMFDEVKDDQTLIYHWDVHHKIYYYCQFGTQEQINKNFQIQCFRRNKHMQHILPDGTRTFPYLSFGSTVGFVLKCGDVQQAELHNCKRLLYTTCRYSCKGSNVTRQMTCELTGPSDNVTAQWSVAQPCVDHPDHSVQPLALLTGPDNSMGKFTSDPRNNVKTTDTTVADENSMSKFTPDPRNNVETTKTTVAMAVADENSMSKFTPDPRNNVETTKTTVAMAVADENSMSKFTPDPRNNVKTTNTNVAMAVADDNSSSEFTSPVFNTETPPLAASKEISYTTLLAITIPTAVGIVVLVLILLIVLYKRLSKWWRKRKSRKVLIQYTSPGVKTHYKDAVINFPSLDAESKQPLVDEQGEDNVRKSSSDSGTNTSQASSEAMLGAAIVNEASADDYSKIVSALNDFDSMKSGFSTWEKTKQFLENDSLAAPAQPEQCCSSVSLLNEQPGSYRRHLRSQLEVISTRTREQALIGYMELHMRSLGYQSLNELKVLEHSYKDQVDEKVSEFFLRVLAGYAVKIGFIMEYFYQHKNWDAIKVILQVHKDCPYCEQFRRL